MSNLKIDLNQIFGEIVEKNLGELDMKAAIKAEVAEYMADIPARKIELVTDDKVKEIKGAHYVFEKVLRSVSTKFPVYLAGEAGV